MPVCQHLHIETLLFTAACQALKNLFNRFFAKSVAPVNYSKSFYDHCWSYLTKESSDLLISSGILINSIMGMAAFQNIISKHKILTLVCNVCHISRLWTTLFYDLHKIQWRNNTNSWNQLKCMYSNLIGRSAFFENGLT